MKNYINYINENNNEDIFQKIISNCQPFINQIKECGGVGFLYHNMIRVNNVMELQHKKKEKTKNTPWTLVEYLDDYLEEKFNWRARTDSFYAYNDNGIRFADDYGDKYFIFPIGDFQYMWNVKVNDLYLYLYYKSDILHTNWNINKNINSKYNDNYPTKQDLIDGKIKNDWFTKDEYMEMYDLIDKIKDDYTNKNYCEYLNYENEIMIKAKSYYLVNLDYDYKKELDLKNRILEYINDNI